jgi:putative solute:sodium symporter small subunit
MGIAKQKHLFKFKLLGNPRTGSPPEVRIRMKPQMEKSRKYWRANLRMVGLLLLIWFLVSYGAGILFRQWLDQFKLGGFKLGFWFAQQGSIYIFVILIFIYVFWMNRLDHKYGYDEDSKDPQQL